MARRRVGAASALAAPGSRPVARLVRPSISEPTRRTAIAASPRAPADVGQRVAALDELHREEPALAVAEELVELHQVRVREVGERAELLLEAVERARRRAASSVFSATRGVALAVERLVDDAEAARAEAAPDLEARGVAANSGPSRTSGGGGAIEEAPGTARVA